MRYRAEIDGLRAVAVAGVIAHHAGFAWLPGGFLGVDVFFVISGFLITSIMLRDFDRGAFSLLDFYERRARRILPAFTVVTLASMVVATVVMSPEGLKNFAQSVLAATLFSSNILFYLEGGYFSAAAEIKPMLHTWSLGVEEQFYLVAPLIMMALVGRRAGWRAPAMAALAAASLCLMVALERVDPDAAFYMAPARAWEILIGVLAAFAARTLPERPADPHSRMLADAGAAAAIGFILLTMASRHADPAAHATAAAPIVLATAAALLLMRGGGLTASALAWRPLVFIGLISFSAYLWHQPLFAFARIVWIGALPMEMRVGLVIATLALAWATWRWVETPFRSREAVGSRTILAFSFTSMAGLVALGAAGHVLHGLPARYSPDALRIIAEAQRSPARERCHFKPDGVARGATLDAPCVFAADRPAVAFLGDSHAVEVAFSAGRLAAPSGLGVAQLTISGGPPSLPLMEYPVYQTFFASAVENLAARREIETVVLMHRHSANLMGGVTEHYPALPDLAGLSQVAGDPAQRRARYFDSFRATIDALLAADKTVVVVAPTPELPEHIADLVLRQDRRVGRFDAVPGVTRSYHDARSRPFMEFVATLPDDPRLRIVDLTDAFCDAATCYAVQNGEALYFDDNHLSLKGAERVARAALAEADALAPRVLTSVDTCATPAPFTTTQTTVSISLPTECARPGRRPLAAQDAGNGSATAG